jgi:hypothetical protein
LERLVEIVREEWVVLRSGKAVWGLVLKRKFVVAEIGGVKISGGREKK